VNTLLALQLPLNDEIDRALVMELMILASPLKHLILMRL